MEVIKYIKKIFDKTTRKFTETYKDYGYNSVTTSDTTVYDTPTNKTFYLNRIIAYNTGSSADTLTIKNGTSTVMVIPVGATSLANVEVGGLPFDDDVKCATGSGTMNVTVIGETTR